MPTVYGFIDLLKNELRNAVVQVLGAPPAAPVTGQIYYDSALGAVRYWDGAQWVDAKAAAGATPAGTVTTQAIGDAPVVGVSTNFAREDHKHGEPAFGAVTAETTFGLVSANGAAVTLARADHTHGSPVHTAAQHTTIPLSTFAAPTANVDWGGFKLTGLGTPTLATDAVTKAYADAAINGLSWKDTVHLASTGNLPLSGLAAIDGVVPAAGDRILAKNQTTAQQNGIYIAAAGAWATAPDWQSQGDVVDAAVFVSAGTANADTAWVMTTDAPITVGTTPLAWSQFGAGASYTAGNGLTLAANQFSAVAGTGISVTAGININFAGTGAAVTASRSDHDHNATYAVLTRLINTTAPLTGGGDLSADRTLGITNFTTAAAGAVPASGGGTVNFLRADSTWAAPPAAIGGNGLTGTGTIDVVAGDTTITVAVNDIRVNTAVIATVASVTAATSGMAKKYAGAVVGNASPEIVTHSLGTRDVTVQVLDGSYNAVAVDWDATTATTVTIRYTPNLPAGSRIVVVG